jgi:hypothetical protein
MSRWAIPTAQGQATVPTVSRGITTLRASLTVLGPKITSLPALFYSSVEDLNTAWLQTCRTFPIIMIKAV